MLEVLSLIENVSHCGDYHAEHGLSLYIRQDERRYLMDTGASPHFLENAEKMGVDLIRLDGVILSHNHFDHIGGLGALLEYNPDVKVCLKRAAQGAFYYGTPLLNKYIGEERGLFTRYAARFVFFDDVLQLSETCRLLSNTSDNPHFFCKDKHLLEKKGGKFVPDEFNHELFAVFEERDGLVVVSSCSHTGIVNILHTVVRAYPGRSILHIIAGFHLMGVGVIPLNCSPDYVSEVADILGRSCTGTIFTCHCTGTAAFDIMKARLGGKISYLETGGRVTVE